MSKREKVYFNATKKVKGKAILLNRPWRPIGL
jgi:hypothetical protein